MTLISQTYLIKLAIFLTKLVLPVDTNKDVTQFLIHILFPIESLSYELLNVGDSHCWLLRFLPAHITYQFYTLLEYFGALFKCFSVDCFNAKSEQNENLLSLI